MQIAIYLHTN